jgi:hypothetical protein
MEGFKRTVANPQAAVQAMQAEVPTLDPAIAAAEIDILSKIYVGPDQKANGIGYNSAADFEACKKLVNTYLGVTLTDASDTFFSNAYVGNVKP